MITAWMFYRLLNIIYYFGNDMKKELSKMSTAELGKLFPIKIVEFNPSWSKYFEQEKEYILNILESEGVQRVVHFGSTAITGMAAKPSIDILVEIPDNNEIRNRIIDKMITNGYQHMKNHPTHLMFVKGYTENGYDEICYHIHMGTKDEEQLWERIYFKDYLTANPSVAEEYSDLKYKLARLHEFDREAYTEAKSDFIKSITLIAKDKKLHKPH